MKFTADARAQAAPLACAVGVQAFVDACDCEVQSAETLLEPLGSLSSGL